LGVRRIYMWSVVRLRFDTSSYPHGFKTPEEWGEVLDEMIFGLEFVGRGCPPDDIGRAKAGLELLSKYFLFLSPCGEQKASVS
jgi:hypothetical protein